MSRLNELIAELCPDGVEYETIDGVCEILDHLRRPIARKNRRPGKYPYYGANGVQDYIDDYIFDGTFLLVGEDGSVINVDNSPVLTWATGKIWVNNHAHVLRETPKALLRFVYYCLQTVDVSLLVRGAPPKLNQANLRRIRIPVPPLPIQQEIVRILDQFTEVEAQLEAELAARKKQYEYYRDLLLTFEHGSVTWMTIEQVCARVTSGGTPRASKPEYYDGDIPWLRTQEVDWRDIYDTEVKITQDGLQNSSAKWIPANCVIVAMYGATAGKVAVNKIPLTTNQACCNLQVDERLVHYRYVFHWLSKNYQKLKSLGRGSQSNINASIIKGFPVPVPSLVEQERIVSILDRFDALVNDLSSGIPAEIEARRKQYEYYRDKLLSFKEAKR